MLIIRKKLGGENILYFLASIIFFRYLIFSTLGYLFNRVGLRHSIISEATYYLVIIILIIFFLFKVNNLYLDRKTVTITFGTVAFFAIALFYTFIVSPNAIQLDRTGTNYCELFVFFPIVIALFAKLDNYERFLRTLILFARVLSIVALITFYLKYYRAGNILVSYDMVLGYQTALCAIVVFYSFYKTKHKYDLIIFILSTVVTVLGGCRGSALVIVFYLFAMLIHYLIKMGSVWKRFLIFVLIFFIVLILYKYYYYILSGVNSFVSGFGIDSRNLDVLLGSNIAEESNLGRISSYQMCISKWDSMPALGYGILGDRMFLNGYYPHNFVVEVITQYGFILGTLIIIGILGATILEVFKTTKREVLLIVCSFVFISLLVSGTYITSLHFYILIGLLINNEYKYQQDEGLIQNNE